MTDEKKDEEFDPKESPLEKKAKEDDPSVTEPPKHLGYR